MAVDSLSLRDCGLEGACTAGGGQAYAPGQDHPSQTHPSGVMQRAGPLDGKCWLNPDQTGHNLVLRHPFPPDIIAYLISSSKRQEKITNSDLELFALVIHEATLLEAVL